MKKILITGANSYIGGSLERWLGCFPGSYQVDTLDMVNPKWREHSFQKYSVVFHVAGIAHQRETKENESLYYEVNYKLAVETAKKAKAEGVRQFIFLSSMSIYGLAQGRITRETIPAPKNFYGKAKWRADRKIRELQSEAFLVVILRPPMVYGKDCKGNYQLLRRWAIKSPLFADFKNERSMIHIDNLSAFVKDVIDHEKSGVFFPQNKEYVSTAEMVKEISRANHKKTFFLKGLNPLIRLLKGRVGVLQKVFGSLVYEKCDLCETVDFRESILRTERAWEGRE